MPCLRLECSYYCERGTSSASIGLVTGPEDSGLKSRHVSLHQEARHRFVRRHLRMKLVGSSCDMVGRSVYQSLTR
jgi:hypothetical protein